MTPKVDRLAILTVFSKTKDFQRSYAITYTKCGSISEMMQNVVVAITDH